MSCALFRHKRTQPTSDRAELRPSQTPFPCLCITTQTMNYVTLFFAKGNWELRKLAMRLGKGD